MHYNPDDLYKEIVLVFFRRDVLNGRNSSYYYYLNWDEWVIRARYLLTQIDESHIEDIFELEEQSPDDQYYGSGQVAVWLAGLLKMKNFLDKVGMFALKEKNPFANIAYFTSLFLYESPQTKPYFQDFIHSEKINDDKKIPAIHCFKLLEKGLKNGFNQLNYQVQPIPNNIIRHTIWTLEFARILRGGINFQQTKELQKKLSELLSKTVTLEQNYFELLRKPTIHRINELRANEELILTEEIERLENSDLMKQLYKGLNHLDLNFIKEKVEDIQNPKAIITFIQSDFQYKISIDVIDLLFQKLATLVNPSFDFYEQYSINLLLRGNQYDEKAKSLYHQAQELKKEFVIENYLYASYSMFR